MIRSAARLAVLLLVSTAVGMGYARYDRAHRNGPNGPVEPLIPSTRAINEAKEEHARWVEQTGISLEEFVEHYEASGAVFDARPCELFEQGHLDAPFITNIPADEAADGQHDDQIAEYLGCTIVIYCASETCEDAEMLWNALQAYGFKESELRVYHPGMAGIEDAGLPVVSGPDPLAYPPDEESPGAGG